MNIHHIMTGLAMPHFDARNALLVGAPPWALWISMMVIASALIVLAVQIPKHRDYS